jgi:putative SOS response-associated peptidase YedK
LRTPQSVLVPEFMAEFPVVVPRYNIAPTQETIVVRLNEAGQRVAVPMKWGLIPSWAKDAKIAASLINARGETVAEKPAFRAAFKRRRCLIPADGYYEWLREGKQKLPHLYQIKQGELFAFAGLWERWNDLETFTVVTTSANDLAAKVHDRMPVILSPLDRQRWLNPEAQAEDLTKLIEPFPSADMTDTPVSTHVNNARNEGPECLASPDANSLF